MNNNYLTLLLKNYVVYFGFIIAFIFFAFILKDKGFLSLNNFMTIVIQTTPLAIMAIGMTFTLTSGEIDLSIGSVVALSSLVTAILLRENIIIVSVLGGLGVGFITGLFNGLLTVKFRIPSLIVTLGTMGIVYGLARTLSLQSVPITNETYNYIFGSGKIGNISILFIWIVAFLIFSIFFFTKSTFGRHVLATGGNKSAAEAAGINTNSIKIFTLIISSMAASVAGLLYAGRLHGARYSLGEADLLMVIAAVVIGGTRLFGGRGSILGAVVGAWLMGMINNGLILMGFSVNEQMIARGVILILAIIISLREAKE